MSIPKEGSYGFVYTFNIANNAPNPDNAYTFLNAILASPEIGASMTKASGFHLHLQGRGPVSDRSGEEVDLVPRRATGQPAVLPRRGQRDEVRSRRSGCGGHQGRLMQPPIVGPAFGAGDITFLAPRD
jgi:hypothetical protein